MVEEESAAVAKAAVAWAEVAMVEAALAAVALAAVALAAVAAAVAAMAVAATAVVRSPEAFGSKLARTARRSSRYAVSRDLRRHRRSAQSVM
jgi:hypothetical protein